MTKSYDIRNIYVATVAKQSKVRQIGTYKKALFLVVAEIANCDWDFSDEKIGLFVKTIGGYKHILTDTIYKIPTCKTGGQYVIKPDEIHELCKYDRNLAKHFITKNNSYRVTLDQISYMEDRFNNELKTEEDLNV